MGWPQIVWILSAIGMGVALVKHEEPREKYIFWVSLISLGIEILFLWKGGFFG